MAERGPEGRGRGGHVRRRPQQRIGEQALVVGRQLALDFAPGGRRGDPVELVEEARDRVALGVEVDHLAGPGPQEEETELLRRQNLGDGVGRHALATGRRHLLAADVEELVGHVPRRLHLEDLAADRVGAIARTTGRSEVLAAALYRDTEQTPLGGPLEVPRQLGLTAER